MAEIGIADDEGEVGGEERGAQCPGLLVAGGLGQVDFGFAGEFFVVVQVGVLAGVGLDGGGGTGVGVSVGHHGPSYRPGRECRA